MVMPQARLAVVGLGRLGAACARTILAAEDLHLGGIVRRLASVGEPLPHDLHNTRVVSEALELGPLTAALVCVPTHEAVGTAQRLLAHRIPVVECATLHGEEFFRHLGEIDHLARRYHTCSIVGAGWDPGILSVFRGLFELLAPGGHSTARTSPGRAVHHTLVARGVRGVRDAVSLDVRNSSGKEQHYIYVQLEPSADMEEVSAALRADPLFAGEEVIVLPVDDIRALEDRDRGVVIERYGNADGGAHRRFLLEARLDPIGLAAEVMTAAARALPTQNPGAYTLFDLPLGHFWPMRAKKSSSW
jgi:diaminopimelate dehydrogenase